MQVHWPSSQGVGVVPGMVPQSAVSPELQVAMLMSSSAAKAASADCAAPRCSPNTMLRSPPCVSAAWPSAQLLELVF